MSLLYKRKVKPVRFMLSMPEGVPTATPCRAVAGAWGSVWWSTSNRSSSPSQPSGRARRLPCGAQRPKQCLFHLAQGEAKVRRYSRCCLHPVVYAAPDAVPKEALMGGVRVLAQSCPAWREKLKMRSTRRTMTRRCRSSASRGRSVLLNAALPVCAAAPPVGYGRRNTRACGNRRDIAL